MTPARASSCGCGVRPCIDHGLFAIQGRRVQPSAAMPRDLPAASTISSLPAHPDIAAVSAAEEAALAAVLEKVDPSVRVSLRAALKGEDVVSPATNQTRRIASRLEGTTPEVQAVLDRFYAANARRKAEQRRALAIANAREAGAVTVTITLGHPPVGALAMIIRQDRLSHSRILLHEGATADELNRALVALGKVRGSYGDDLNSEFAVVVPDRPGPAIDARLQAYLDRLLRHVQATAPKQIEGIGMVRTANFIVEGLARVDP